MFKMPIIAIENNEPELPFEHHEIKKEGSHLVMVDEPFRCSSIVSYNLPERQLIREMFFKLEQTRLEHGIDLWNDNKDSFYNMFIKRQSYDIPYYF